MKKKETKKPKLIDSTEGNNAAEDAAPNAAKDSTDQSDDSDDLPEGQMKELDDALAASHIGETLTLEEFKEAMDRMREQSTDDQEENKE